MYQKSKKSNGSKKWLVLLNIPLQMGLIVFVGAAIGKWFDSKYSSQGSLYTKIFTLGGVAIALYNVVQQVNKLNDKEN